MKAFDEKFATKYGLNASLIFNHIFFWTRKNAENGKNYHDGRTWMYETLNGFQTAFPYLTKKDIRKALSILCKHGLIMRGNYNKTPFDRTIWYALTDEAEALVLSQNAENPHSCRKFQMGKSKLPNGQIEVAERANRSCQTGTPIPEEKTEEEHITTQNIIFSDDDEKSDAPIVNPFLAEAKEVLVTLGKKREPTQHELSLYSKWRTEYYISHEVILRSCELTGGANEPSFSYLSRVMDTLRSEHICDIREYESYKAEKERHEKFCDDLFARMGESRKPSLTQRLRIKQFTDEYNLSHDVLNMCADRARDRASPFEALCRMASTLRSAGITDFYEARDYIDRINNQSSSQGTGYGSPDGYMRHRYTAEELARVCVNLDED